MESSAKEKYCIVEQENESVTEIPCTDSFGKTPLERELGSDPFSDQDIAAQEATISGESNDEAAQPEDVGCNDHKKAAQDLQ